MKERKRIMSARKIAVIMGSDSDLPVVKKALDKIKSFGIEYECHIMSAHRTPRAVCEFAERARGNDFGVIICAAGMAAHLAGIVAAHTTLPVIGIPCSSKNFGGLDALLSTVQMPSGIPVATVAVDGAENAAILAIQILALSNDVIDAQLSVEKRKMIEKINEKDRNLQEQLASED